MNILDAIADNAVFGRHLRGSTWDAWRAFLAALFALPMSAKQLANYQKHTGRSAPPSSPSHEAWLVIGRRGGKSFILALIAVFLACFKDWRPFLGPGEIGTVMVVSQDRRGARTIMRFALGLLKAVPMLKRQIESVTRESITLKGGIVIEVHTASFRSTRGYSIVAALLDELAFWEIDETSAEPDVEVINAIKPGMATIPEAMLLCASSPYARKGALYDAHRKHFGKDGDPILVWQATTRDMNPAVPQSYIDQHVADDPARASSEYLAQFRTDVEAFVLREAVEACVSRGVYERAPAPAITYHAFVDPSGGSADSMTVCVGHFNYGRQTITIDALREFKPPFSPEIVVGEISRLLKNYRIFKIEGDRFAGIWPVELFQKQGILYEQTALAKSRLYQDLLPLVNSVKIELLDEPRSIAQLMSLERRVARGGSESIDHPPGGHDDLINAIAGVAAINNKFGGFDSTFSFVDNDDQGEADAAAAWRRAQFRGYLMRLGAPPWAVF